MKFEITASFTDSDKEFVSALRLAVNQGSSLEDKKGLLILSRETRAKFVNFLAVGDRITHTDLVIASEAAHDIVVSLKKTMEENYKTPGGMISNNLVQHHLNSWRHLQLMLLDLKVKFDQHLIAKNGKLF